MWLEKSEISPIVHDDNMGQRGLESGGDMFILIGE